MSFLHTVIPARTDSISLNGRREAHDLAHPMVAQLRAAAQVFDRRHDSFAAGKAQTCHDIAAKLERFGSFASEAQEAFAAKLVLWSQPRPASAPAARPVLRMPVFHEVLQRHAKFVAGKLSITRRNGDQLCWIKHDDAEKVIGKIDGGEVTLWARPGIDMDAVRAVLAEFEINPLEAAMKHGKLSGRCCSCGRDLTDPQSIAAGIGPICANKF